MTAVFLKLLNMSIAASWLVLVVLVLRIMLKRAPKAVRCFLWALVAVRLMCPISLESIFSLIPSAETVPQEIMYVQEPAIHSGVSALNAYVNPIISETLAPKPESSVNPMQKIVFAATFLWLVGVVGMICYGLISYLRLYRRTAAGLRIEENIWRCDYISTPFILGIIHPHIFLPSSLPEADAAYVIAHEKAHIKRRDHWWKPLGYALLTVYWFNPVMWFAYVLLCRDIELACDERVIKDMGEKSKKPYLEALINCSSSHKMITACPLAFGEVGVEHRIKNVLYYKKPAFWLMVVAVIVCIVAAVCFLTDPVEHTKEPDLSFLNYENAISLVADQEEIMAIHCPVVEKNGNGLIQVGAADGSDLAVYLDGLTWEVCDEPKDSLSSPGSVEFFIEDDYRIQIYKRKAGSLFAYGRVKYGEEERYYRAGYKDYEEAVVILRSAKTEISQQEEPVMDIWGIPTSFQAEAIEYFYPDSPEVIMPRLSLYLTNKRFSFSYSAFSSQLAPGGTYEITDSELILTTDDSAQVYVFQRNGDNYVFDEARSDSIPRYNYGLSGKMQSPVPDGAVFEPVAVHLSVGEEEAYSAVMDCMIADVDKDGKEEVCTVSYGRTSGIFTFQFDIKEYGSEELEYSNVFTSRQCELDFYVSGLGDFYLRGNAQGEHSEEYILAIGFEDGNIVLMDDETGERLSGGAK